VAEGRERCHRDAEQSARRITQQKPKGDRNRGSGRKRTNAPGRSAQNSSSDPAKDYRSTRSGRLGLFQLPAAPRNIDRSSLLWRRWEVAEVSTTPPYDTWEHHSKFGIPGFAYAGRDSRDEGALVLRWRVGAGPLQRLTVDFAQDRIRLVTR